jgi:hypothetical protein
MLVISAATVRTAHARTQLVTALPGISGQFAASKRAALVVAVGCSLTRFLNDAAGEPSHAEFRRA